MLNLRKAQGNNDRKLLRSTKCCNLRSERSFKTILLILVNICC